MARAGEGNYASQDPRYRALEEVLKAFVSVLMNVASERSQSFLLYVEVLIKLTSLSAL